MKKKWCALYIVFSLVNLELIFSNFTDVSFTTQLFRYRCPPLKIKHNGTIVLIFFCFRYSTFNQALKNTLNNMMCIHTVLSMPVVVTALHVIKPGKVGFIRLNSDFKWATLNKWIHVPLLFLRRFHSLPTPGDAALEISSLYSCLVVPSACLYVGMIMENSCRLSTSLQPFMFFTQVSL